MTNTNENTIRLGRNDAALYEALDTLNGMDYAQEHGEFFATNDKLKELTGIKTNTELIRSIRKLEKHGIIDRKAGKRGEASVYRFHEAENIEIKNVTETENQQVMSKKRKNVTNNVTEMLPKLKINELRDIFHEVVTHEMLPILDELREINAKLLKISNGNTLGNTFENVTNKNEANSLKISKGNTFEKKVTKNESVTSDTETETEKETEIKNTLRVNYSSSHAPARVASVPESVDEFSFSNLVEGVNPSGGDDVPEGGDGSSRVADSLDTSADEDFSFNEFLVNGDDSPTGNATDAVTTTCVDTSAPPQSGDPKKIAPPAPPRAAPSTDQAPQDAQDLPMSAFCSPRGIEPYPRQNNATGAKYGGRTSDLITAALEAIDNAKRTRQQIGKIRDLDGCMAVVTSMDEAYKAMAAVVKQAQERARMSEVGYTGYLCINDVWATDRSGWTEKQKNMIYHMAQDVDNLMLHHPFKTRLDRLHELIENLAHEPNPEKGENLIEKILNHIDALTSIADGSPMREKKINDIAAGDFAKALDAHSRLTDMLKQYTFDEPTTSTTEEPATAYNTIEAVMQHAAKTQNNKEVNI